MDLHWLFRTDIVKDPASFGPPPKHVNRSEVKPHSPVVGKSYNTTGLNANPNSVALKTAPSGGWGAPLPQETIEVVKQYGQHAEEEEEEARPKPPPMPYRANTTGLNTSNLPKPPIRMVDNDPEEYQSPQSASTPSTSRPRPQPPPRLPARQNSHPDEFSAQAPPPYTAATQTAPGQLNQGSLNRLGQAGVSVPGLDIGRTTSPPSTSAVSQSPQATGAPSSGQLSELQARFNRMPGRVSSPPAQSPQQTGGGTTWAQKQAALSTASKFNKDPSSVSLSDAKAAGSTLNNFRERHGEQVASGWQSAQGLDKKYGVSGKVGGWAQGQGQSQEPSPSPIASPPPSASAAAGKKPPPPPPKKKNLTEAFSNGTSAPPIPHFSKPRQ